MYLVLDSNELFLDIKQYQEKFGQMKYISCSEQFQNNCGKEPGFGYFLYPVPQVPIFKK